MAQPEPPADTATDKAVAEWIASGFDAGQNCRDNLAAVKAIVSAP